MSIAPSNAPRTTCCGTGAHQRRRNQLPEVGCLPDIQPRQHDRRLHEAQVYPAEHHRISRRRAGRRSTDRDQRNGERLSAAAAMAPISGSRHSHPGPCSANSQCSITDRVRLQSSPTPISFVMRSAARTMPSSPRNRLPPRSNSWRRSGASSAGGSAPPIGPSISSRFREHFPEKWTPVFRRQCDQACKARPPTHSELERRDGCDAKQLPSDAIE